MNQTVKEGKTMAIVSYLLIIGTVIAWSMNSEKPNKFASFHIRQALGIDILYLLFAVLVPAFNTWWVSTPFYIVFFVLWAYGITGAIQGKLSIIPILGPYFQKWFNKLVR